MVQATLLKQSLLFCALTGSFACAHADLVDITAVNLNICVELRYATPNNFTKKKLYTSPICYVRSEVAQALNKVQQELEKLGLGLKIWDGYHPQSVEQELQHVMRTARNMSVTPEPGRHTRGTAVDCTLIWRDTGQDLVMPTDFDDFSPEAKRTNFDIKPEALSNSFVLAAVMAEHGFTPSPDEWWHFDYQGWQDCEPIGLK